MDNVLPDIINGITVGSLYSIVALAIVVVYKSSKVLNFAQGQLTLLVGFIAWSMTSQIGLPLWLGFIVTLGLGVLAGWTIDRFTFRPLIGQPILAMLMMTLVVSNGIWGVSRLIWGPTRGYIPSVFPKEPLRVGEIVIGQVYLWSFVLAIVLFVFFYYFYRRTRAGLAMRAVAEDHQVAQAQGIKVATVFSQSWILASIFAVFTGILLGSSIGVNWGLGDIALKGLPAALVGGLESIPGAIIAGPIIGICENLGARYLGPLIGGGAIKDITPYFLLLAILLLRPHGLFGEKRIERV